MKIEVLDLSVQTLAKLQRQRRGKTVVFTSGVFDILHVGHLRLLQQAKSMGDILVVGVNSDASVKRLAKGKDRPIHTLQLRMEMLQSQECVDFVLAFEEDTPCELIEKLSPDLHVKGGDYSFSDLPEGQIVVKGGGGVMIVPLRLGHSSTLIINRLRAD